MGDGFNVFPVFSHLAFSKEISPFLMFDYAAPKKFAPNKSQDRKGVGQHPHRGFETVTLAYQVRCLALHTIGGRACALHVTPPNVVNHNANLVVYTTHTHTHTHTNCTEPQCQPRGLHHTHTHSHTRTQGEVEHADSIGNKGVIGAGDVQWMTAGRGIIHQEYHSTEWSKKGGVFEFCQLWVNLPAKHKMTAPR